MAFIDGQGPQLRLGSKASQLSPPALRRPEDRRPCTDQADIEGAEMDAIQGAEGMDAMFVYEDWPRSGLPVTRYPLPAWLCPTAST